VAMRGKSFSLSSTRADYSRSSYKQLAPFLCALVATGSQLMLCSLVFFFGIQLTDDTMNVSIVERLILFYVWTSPVSGFSSCVVRQPTI
jgi:hypothetical protein